MLATTTTNAALDLPRRRTAAVAPTPDLAAPVLRADLPKHVRRAVRTVMRAAADSGLPVFRARRVGEMQPALADANTPATAAAPDLPVFRPRSVGGMQPAVVDPNTPAPDPALIDRDTDEMSRLAGRGDLPRQRSQQLRPALGPTKGLTDFDRARIVNAPGPLSLDAAAIVGPPVDPSGFGRARTVNPQPPDTRDEYQRAVDQVRLLRNTPVEDENGRGQSGLYGIAKGIQSGGETDSVGRLLGRALGGFVGGAINSKHDEQDRRLEDIRKAQLDAQEQGAAAKNRREQEQSQATNDLHRATARYYDGKPQQEADKAAAAQRTREFTAAKGNLQLFKGQQLDVNNPTHAALLQRAANAGLIVDPDSWNNAASNLVRVDVVDPDHPTQTRNQFFNKATGELSDAGQRGYVQPVNASGMTTAQERTDADRDAGRAATQSRFERTNALANERFTSGEAQRTFNLRTRGAFEQLRSIQTKIEKFQTAAAKAEMRPEVARQRIAELEAAGAHLSDGIERAREEALRASGGGAGGGGGVRPGAGTRTPRSAPAAGGGGGAYSGQRFPRANLEGIRRKLGVASIAEAQRLLEANGAVID